MNALTRTLALSFAFILAIGGIASTQGVSEQQPQSAPTEMAVNTQNAGIRAVEPPQTGSPPIIGPTRSTSLSFTTPQSRWPFLQSGCAASVLVIPSAEIETKDLLTINEDLNVMSRIFETTLQQAHISMTGGGILIDTLNASPLMGALAGRGNSSIQSLYLQGYGALFLMKVDFPLSPAYQDQQQQEPQKEQQGDKVWEDTRRRLYEPETFTRRKKDDSAPKYDAQKVESLKTTVVGALKHASNIRNLKPDESVIVTITGAGKSDSVKGIVLQTEGRANSPNRILVRNRSTGTTRFEIIDGKSVDELGLSVPTVLVIRAKKSDIESFAKGDLDLEEFGERVQILSYPLLAGLIAAEDAIDTVRNALRDLR